MPTSLTVTTEFFVHVFPSPVKRIKCSLIKESQVNQNADQEYILDCLFLSIFSKYGKQRHQVASFGTKHDFDLIVLSVKC
jgi:hypothetical protein